VINRHQMACLAGVLVCLAWTAAPHADGPQPTLQVRLTSSVSSSHSRPGDPVSAVSVTYLVVDGRIAATPGCALTGVVLESRRPKSLRGSEVVALAFTRLVGRDQVVHPLGTQLIGVDNARERVDGNGRILSASPGNILKIALNGVQVVRELASKAVGWIPPEINYKPGAELLLRVTDAPAASSIVCGPVAPELEPSPELSQIVDAAPVRTTTMAGHPSDVTNLVFVGSREDLFAGFAAAGWLTARAMSPESDLLMFLAAFARAGYARAPVSRQLLDGRRPDAVFEKQLNTFGKRHHVRIWQRSDTFRGQPVWIAAATHDTAFVPSKQLKLFTHGVDPNLDDERQKIVNDLAFAGAVASDALVDRPNAARQFRISIGESVHTDGKVAVVVLRTPARPER
jgi:hypothetical protein